jgi:hypothetical protein
VQSRSERARESGRGPRWQSRGDRQREQEILGGSKDRWCGLPHVRAAAVQG